MIVSSSVISSNSQLKNEAIASSSSSKKLISELSPGEKLSLKGKLYELRKKLNIIDIEEKRNSELSFQPELIEYNLPQYGNFISNTERAAIMRKQKLELLKSTLHQQEEQCSFSPHFSTRVSKKTSETEHIPVQLRNFDKEKANKIKQQREESKQYDNDRKLFQPQINKNIRKDTTNMSTNSSIQSVSADEYLYREACNREERHRQRSIEAKKELESIANSQKMNKQSDLLLKRKAEREVRAVFDILDTSGLDKLGYDDLQIAVELLSKKGAFHQEQVYQATEQIWSVLDYQNEGFVSFPNFLKISIPFTLRNSTTGIWHASPNIPIDNNNNNNLKNSNEEGEFLPSNDEINAFRSVEEKNTYKIFISNMIIHIRNDNPNAVSSISPRERKKIAISNAEKIRDKKIFTFSPEISMKSRKLALKTKENVEKDLNLSTNNNNTSSIISDNNSQEQVEDIPPPPVVELSSLELLILRQQLTLKKKEEKRMELIKKEMEQCTFQPKISTKAPRTPIAYKTSLNSSSISSINKALVTPSKPTHLDNNLNNRDDEFISPPAPPPPFDNNIDDSDIKNGSINKDVLITDTISVHNRLYALKDKPIKLKDSDFVSKVDKDFQEQCTFSPTIHAASPNLNSKSADNIMKSKAFEKSVERIRTAREIKEKKEIDDPAIFNEERYIKSRVLLEEGFKPFTFESDKRLMEKHDKKQKKDAKLYVDVKLMPNKTVNIAICEGDDPIQVAVSFCKIYGIDSTTSNALAEIVRQNMIDNNVAMSSRSYNVAINESNKNYSLSNTNNFNQNFSVNDDQVCAYTYGLSNNNDDEEVCAFTYGSSK